MAKRERRLTPRVLGPEILIFPAVLAAPVVVLTTSLIKGKFSPLVIVLGVVVIELTAVGMFARSFYRVRKLLRRHGRFICLNCLYPLTGLPDSGVCPECSEPYSRDELARLWKSWEEAVNKGKEIAKQDEQDDGAA